MKAPLYNKKGKEIGKIELPEEFFNVEMNKELVRQVFICQAANKRQGSAHSKDRGEVRGGGKKPWRQKGTGRARHGSIRSPIWKGGGVAFGPINEKNYKKRIPREMKRRALSMVLSEKLRDKEIVFVDNLDIEKPKTKFIKEMIDNLPIDIKNKTMILSYGNRNMILASGNILKVSTMPVRNINVLDLLSCKNLIMPEKALGIIKETFV